MLNHTIFNERPESQDPAIELLVKLGYEYLAPADAEQQRGNLSNVVLMDDLTRFLKDQRYNYKGQAFQFSTHNIAKAIRDIDIPLQMGLMNASKEIYDSLIYGKSYEETLYDSGKSSFDLKFINWEEPEKNIIRVIEEFSVERPNKSHRRPDLVLTINGIPLVVIECKKSSIDVKEGVRQTINNWKPDEIPQLFKFAQVVIAMNPHCIKYGTCGTKEEFFVSWKEKDNDWLENECAKHIQNRTITAQDRSIISLLSINRLFELIRHYTLYDNGIKKIARYQQFFGIEKAMKRIKKDDDSDTRSGVIWHTQGSGKSLTMVMLVKKIIAETQKSNSEIKNPRFVLVNDRINLDKQLRDNFANTQMSPTRAKTGKGLINLLKDEGETVITTVIHKFENAAKQKIKVNDENIFILIDECHRTQSGNFHNFMTDVLPDAIKIGFTGTPLLRNDKQNTYKRIGPLIDSYPINKAEEDKVIVPLIYEGRKIPQKTTGDAIDRYLEQILLPLNELQKKDLKQKWSSFTKIAQTDTRIKMIAFAIKEHYENFIKPNGFKAMVAESSRVSAIELHQTFKTIGIKSAVVISPETKDESDSISETDKSKIARFFKTEIEPMYGQNNEAYEEWAKNAFTNGDDVDILVVKDKLLTGFDAPIARVLYIDKSMKTHNLLQAIARVNRVYPGKPNGIIVDFWGLFKELNTAMDMYSDETSGMNDYDKEDIEGTLHGPEDEKQRLRDDYTNLLSIFAGKNMSDQEELQLDLEDQEVRKDFYEKLSAFSSSLELAVSSYNIYSLVGIEQMQVYKAELIFFQKLRGALKIRYSEVIDFSEYEPGIKNLLNMFVGSEADKIVVNPVFISDKEGMMAELAKLPSDRAKADAIKTRLEASISKRNYEDPILFKTFKDLIDETISQYNQNRNSETYLATMEKMADDYRQGFVGNKYPSCIDHDDHAKAFYGSVKLELSKKINIEENSDLDVEMGNLSLGIKKIINRAIKPGWHNNIVLINQIKQNIEDLIFDFLDKNQVSLSMEELDIIEDQILMTAKSRL